MSRRLLVGMVVLCLAAAGRAETGGIVRPDGTLATFMFGNSLIRNLSVGNGLTGNRLQQLFAAGGVDYTYGTQLAGGARLYQHLDQNGGDGSGTQTYNHENSVGAPAFGDYDNALRNYTFDAIVFQPFANHLDYVPAPSTADDRQFVLGDRQAINALIDYAQAREPQVALGGRYVPPTGVPRYDLDHPNTHNVSSRQFYIYETWPNVQGVYDRTLGDTYAEFWTAGYFPALSTQQALPNRDFFDQMVSEIQADNPDLPTPVRGIPAGEVLYRLDLQIQNGQLPGVQAFFDRPEVAAYYAKARDRDGDGEVLDDFAFDGFLPHRGVLNFYADNIHMNDQPHNGDDSGTIGSYVVAMTWYATLTGQDPAGLPVDAYELLDPQLDAELIAALQQTVWDVVRDDPDTGVGGPVLPGDANRDGSVTDADYTIWADHYGQTNATWYMGDFTGNGVVTEADYTIWADHYGTSAVPAAPAALLLAAGLPVLLRRASRSVRGGAADRGQTRITDSATPRTIRTRPVSTSCRADGSSPARARPLRGSVANPNTNIARPAHPRDLPK